MRRSSKPKKYFIGNFVLGMRRDGALTQEETRDEEAGGTPYILHSLKTLENYDINFVDGSIYPRAGYERFNPDVLPVENGGVEQIFYHTNLRRDRDDIFVVANERWYRVMPTEGSPHEMLIDEAVTVDNGYKKPMIVWGDRIFFATDSGWYWTDEDRVYDGTKYYQAGLPKPSEPPTITETDTIGYTDDAGEVEIVLDDDAHRKITYKMTLSSQAQFDVVNIKLIKTVLEPNANLRVSIYTDNEGEPSTTLADPDAQSQWVSTFFVNVASSYVQFLMGKQLNLSPATYWIVLEGDTNYYNRYTLTGELSYVSILKKTAGGTPSNYSIMVYNWGSKTWGTYANSIAIFYLGSLISTRLYDYVYTYLNSTYGVESRPSDHYRMSVSANYKMAYIVIPAISDQVDEDQVDKIRIYRRLLDAGLESNATDDDITSTYRLVAEIDYGDSYNDCVSESGLGADLQTQDHYRITEADDTSNNRRDAIIPACACIWKGRIWVVPVNSNTLYFSKKLEEDGATGLTGDPIPDYFPLTNKLEIQEEAAILAIKPLANDQMAIYFRNGPVYVLWGMDEVLNPPVDYSYRPMVYNIGLTSSWGVCDFRGEHIYLSRHGLYAYSGGPVPRYLSQNIQSILNDISDDNLAKSVLVARGEEIWLLIDEDDDGYKDTIYILDLQKSIASWRRYSYGVNISDLFVKALSSSSRDVIAIDNSNYYVMELETGTTDNGKPITSFLETHKNDVDMAFIHGVRVSGFYSDGDVPSSYDILITDHTGYGTRIQLNPASSMDDRGHYSGVRIKTYGAFELELEQLSVKPTNLRKIILEYNEG
uniref:Uncharacterized protein n=1 Tax=viral metagenome TaxID=1070528 RepID=A0A6M3K4F2_9ZZZZ